MVQKSLTVDAYLPYPPHTNLEQHSTRPTPPAPQNLLQMAPTMPQAPACERRAVLTDTEIYLLHATCDATACPVEKYCDDDRCRAAGMTYPTTYTVTPASTAAVDSAMACCTEPICEFDFDPSFCPPSTTACMDSSACFTLPCLDETCLDYATTPCQEPGCPETTTTTCDDPQCEDSLDCLQCLEEGPSQTCTTCCMADICPNPTHSHLPKHHHSIPPGYVPWVQQPAHYMHYTHEQPSVCTSQRSSVEPRLSAALQNSYGIFDTSSVTTDTRSMSVATDLTTIPDTPQRGGHRRLQGMSARQPDGTYMCHWHPEGAPMPCSQVFVDAQGLHEHIQAIHSNGSASFHPCLWSGCDSGAFNTKPKLARHLHSHTEFKPHKCDHPGCHLAFVTQQQRDVHKKKHTGEKPFTCDECGKAFAYMDLLKSHQRSGVHGKPEKKFACVICGEGFSDSSNRTKHTKSVHDPIAGVPCPELGCTYVDTRREKLRLHCESTGHALALVRSSREWDEFFNNEQNLRKPHRGHRKKRSAVQAGLQIF